MILWRRVPGKFGPVPAELTKCLLRRAFVQSHLSTELFSIAGQNGAAGDFDICVLNGTRRLLTLK
jgi:hypothetical protein